MAKSVLIAHPTPVDGVTREPGAVLSVADRLATRLVAAGRAVLAPGGAPITPLPADPLPQYGFRQAVDRLIGAPAANGLLIVGDSFTDSVGAGGTGYAGLLAAALGSPPTLIAGVGGERVDQIAARLETLLASLPASVRLRVVVLQGGGNDALQSTPIATTKAGYLRAAAAIKAYGAIPVFTTVAPAFTEPETARTRAVNAWLIDKAAVGGWLIADVTTPLLDAATNRMAAAVRADDTHVNAVGHGLMVDAIAPVVRPLLPVVTRGMLPIASGAAPGSVLATNQCFTGVVTSGIPAGWETVSGVTAASAVHTVIDPPAGRVGWRGKVFRISLPAGTAGHAVKRYLGANSIVAGRRYRLVGRTVYTATGLPTGAGPSYQVKWNVGGTAYLLGPFLYGGDLTLGHDVTAPAGATSADIMVYLAPQSSGAQQVDLAQIDLIDTTVRDNV